MVFFAGFASLCAIGLLGLVAAQATFVPKRIFCVSPGYFGHLKPILDLCSSLSALGHEVVVGSSELFNSSAFGHLNEHFVTDAGMAYVCLDSKPVFNDVEAAQDGFLAISYVMDSYWTNLSLFKWSLVNHFVVLWNPYFHSTTNFIKTFKPDLMIVEGGALGAFDAAALTATPVVHLSTVAVGPSLGAHVKVNKQQPAFGTSYASISPESSTYVRWSNAAAQFFGGTMIIDALAPLLVDRFRHGLSPQSLSANWVLDVAAYISISSWVVEYPLALPDKFHLVGPLFVTQREAFTSTATAAKPDQLVSHWQNPHHCSGKRLVYVAFGTQVKISPDLAREVVAGLHRVLMQDSSLCALWAVPARQMLTVEAVLKDIAPSTAQADFTPLQRLTVRKWVPQVDVLNSTNTVLFISHCGMNSAGEAMYFGTMLICVPFYADQPGNANRFEHFGSAHSVLYHRTVAAEVLASAVQAALADTAAAERVRNISHAVREGGGLEMALEIVQGVLQFPSHSGSGPDGSSSRDDNTAVGVAGYAHNGGTAAMFVTLLLSVAYILFTRGKTSKRSGW